MQNYLDLLRDIKENGTDKDDRDGDGEYQTNPPLDGKEVDLQEAPVNPGLEDVTQTDAATVQNSVCATVLRSGTL